MRHFILVWRGKLKFSQVLSVQFQHNNCERDELLRKQTDYRVLTENRETSEEADVDRPSGL